MRKILVPIDFSDASERAVIYAAALARRLHASLHLVHVLELSMVNRPQFDYEADMPALRERLYQDARRRLGELAARLGGDALRVSTEVRTGEPNTCITDAEIDYGADLVIMSTHGRSGLSHLLLGSVTEQVIRTAQCPVLVLRDCGQVHVHRPRAAALQTA